MPVITVRRPYIIPHSIVYYDSTYTVTEKNQKSYIPEEKSIKKNNTMISFVLIKYRKIIL